MSVSKTLGNHGSNDYVCLLCVHKTQPTIVLLCESAQPFRALLMILQYHKTLSMIFNPRRACAARVTVVGSVCVCVCVCVSVC